MNVGYQRAAEEEGDFSDCFWAFRSALPHHTPHAPTKANIVPM